MSHLTHPCLDKPCPAVSEHPQQCFHTLLGTAARRYLQLHSNVYWYHYVPISSTIAVGASFSAPTEQSFSLVVPAV